MKSQSPGTALLRLAQAGRGAAVGLRQDQLADGASRLWVRQARREMTWQSRASLRMGANGS